MTNPYDDLGSMPESTLKPEKKPMAKPITKSKTFWINMIAGVGSVIAMFTQSDLVAQNPEYAAYGVTAIAIVNLVLRLFTREAVKVV